MKVPVGFQATASALVSAWGRSVRLSAAGLLLDPRKLSVAVALASDRRSGLSLVRWVDRLGAKTAAKEMRALLTAISRFTNR